MSGGRGGRDTDSPSAAGSAGRLRITRTAASNCFFRSKVCERLLESMDLERSAGSGNVAVLTEGETNMRKEVIGTANLTERFAAFFPGKNALTIPLLSSTSS